MAEWQETWSPWAGMVLGFVAWAISQQGGNMLVHWSCRRGSSLPILAIGLIGAIVTVAGLLLSRRGARASGAGASEANRVRHFISVLCTGVAGVFLLAIIGQTAAGLVFTGCER